MAEIPHISFPFQRDPKTGKVAVVEQDTDEHIDSCCQVIIRCPTGFRDARPDFGWPWPEFSTQPISTEAIVRALRDQEPRASNVTVRQWAESAASGEVHLSIDVETRT